MILLIILLEPTLYIKQPDYNKYTFNNNTIVLANNPNYISNNHKYYLEIVDNSNY